MERCIEYIEKMIFKKTGVTETKEVEEIKEKMKRTILNQKRDPEENDMLEVEHRPWIGKNIEITCSCFFSLFFPLRVVCHFREFI